MRRIRPAVTVGRVDWLKTACVVWALCTATAIASSAQTFTTITSLDNTSGPVPTGSLVQGIDGNFYGTTALGGGGYGTVFKVTPTGSLTTIYAFCAQPSCADGFEPLELVQAPNGNFYGTTYSGGAEGRGTVFKITPGGTLTQLYSFSCGQDCANGQQPGGLVWAADGSFYGVTSGGGTGAFCSGFGGCGTVFTITPGGALTTLYSFNQTDGYYPLFELLQAGTGFFGVTYGGGSVVSTFCPGGCGTVFKITPGGNLTSLHSFDFTDGKSPSSSLVLGRDGSYYGTTTTGGAAAFCTDVNEGCGTMYKITAAGVLTSLYDFCAQANCADGEFPQGGLVEGTDGNFYGMTAGGGDNDDGTIFRITPQGTLTTLHDFCPQTRCNDGPPEGGLLQATDGNFYGTTGYGGAYGYGTVFRLSVGLGPFVKTLPDLRPVGTPVAILGTNLTGATSVAFNGTAAAFKVVSPSLITTTVPAGATTGKVQVVTPGGTLSSNAPFRVRP